MRPESEALAYRIWAYCEPRGWDVTRSEIAEALGESWHRINRVTVVKGWNRRLRGKNAGFMADPRKDIRNVPARLNAEEARIELGVEVSR
jgi:hypothetical protein